MGAVMVSRWVPVEIEPRIRAVTAPPHAAAEAPECLTNTPTEGRRSGPLPSRLMPDDCHTSGVGTLDGLDGKVGRP